MAKHYILVTFLMKKKTVLSTHNEAYYLKVQREKGFHPSFRQLYIETTFIIRKGAHQWSQPLNVSTHNNNGSDLTWWMLDQRWAHFTVSVGYCFPVRKSVYVLGETLSNKLGYKTDSSYATVTNTTANGRQNLKGFMPPPDLKKICCSEHECRRLSGVQNGPATIYPWAIRWLVTKSEFFPYPYGLPTPKFCPPNGNISQNSVF